MPVCPVKLVKYFQKPKINDNMTSSHHIYKINSGNPLSKTVKLEIHHFFVILHLNPAMCGASEED